MRIIKGGLIIPGKEYKTIKNNLWAGYVGGVKGNVYSSVYYYLKILFDETSFAEKIGLDF